MHHLNYTHTHQMFFSSYFSCCVCTGRALWFPNCSLKWCGPRTVLWLHPLFAWSRRRSPECQHSDPPSSLFFQADCHDTVSNSRSRLPSHWQPSHRHDKCPRSDSNSQTRSCFGCHSMLLGVGARATLWIFTCQDEGKKSISMPRGRNYCGEGH